MPLLAISPRFFHPVFSRYHNAVLHFDAAASRLIPYQHFTFIPLLMVAKFGKMCSCTKTAMLTTLQSWELLPCAAEVDAIAIPEIAAKQCAWHVWDWQHVVC